MKKISKPILLSYFKGILFVYYSEMKDRTPYEMGLLIRAVYDFVGIVKIANEAFI